MCAISKGQFLNYTFDEFVFLMTAWNAVTYLFNIRLHACMKVCIFLNFSCSSVSSISLSDSHIGGSSEFSMDLQQKEQLHDNVPMMQSPHFPVSQGFHFDL